MVRILAVREETASVVYKDMKLTIKADDGKWYGATILTVKSGTKVSLIWEDGSKESFDLDWVEWKPVKTEGTNPATTRTAFHGDSDVDNAGQGWADGDTGKNPHIYSSNDWLIYEAGRWMRQNGIARPTTVKKSRGYSVTADGVNYKWDDRLWETRAIMKFIPQKK